MKEQLIYHYLDDDDLLRISNVIKENEKQTAGEICLSIKEKKPFFKQNTGIRQYAEAEFFRLGIDKTRDKTGILIFLSLKEREFYILADSGINGKVNQQVWDNIKDNMQQMFVQGEFANGLIHGINETGKILAQYFPIKPDDTNEISNKVIIN